MSGRSLRFALGVATCVSTVLAAAWWIGADAQTASPPLPSESASAPPQPGSASAVPSAGGSYVVAAPTAYGEQPLLPPIPVAAPPPQTQARLGLRDPILHELLGLVRVGAELEGDIQRHHAIGRRLARHVAGGAGPRAAARP